MHVDSHVDKSDKVTLSQKEAGVCSTIFTVCPKRVLLFCSTRELANSKGKKSIIQEKESKSYRGKNSQEWLSAYETITMDITIFSNFIVPLYLKHLEMLKLYKFWIPICFSKFMIRMFLHYRIFLWWGALNYNCNWWSVQ